MLRLGSIASWILAGTVFAVSVVTANLTGLGALHPFTYDEVALPRFVVALLGLSAVWIILSLMAQRGFRLAWDPVATCLLALAGWATLSGALAGTTTVWLGQSERLEGVVTVWMYVAAYIAGLQVGGSKRALRMLCVAFVAAAVTLSVHGVLQVLEIDPTDYTTSGYSFYLGSAFATLGNPNFLAGHLVLALPLSVGLGLTSRGGGAKWAWFAAAVLIVGTVFTTYSQGAWLAVLIQVAALVALLLWRRYAKTHPDSRARARSVTRVAIAAGLVLLIGVTAIVGVTEVAKRGGNRLWGSGLAETGSARVLLLRTTAAAVADRPVLGFGPDNYLAAFRLHHPEGYSEEFGNTSTNSNAHFWIAQYAATVGVPGALLLAAALLLGLFRVRPRVPAGEEGERASDHLRTAVWIGALGFVAQLMLSVSMIASTVPFWILLGAMRAPAGRQFAVRRSFARVAMVATAAVAVVAVAGSAFVLSADATYIRSRLAFNDMTAEDDLALARKAAALNPLSVKYSRAAAQSASSLVFEAVAGGAEEAEVRARLAVALEEFDAALARSPHDYATWSWRAGVLAAAGSHLDDVELAEQALDSVSRAAELDTDHTEIAPLLKDGPTQGAVRSSLLVPGLP